MLSMQDMDLSISGVYIIICPRGTKLYIILYSDQTLQMFFYFKSMMPTPVFSSVFFKRRISNHYGMRTEPGRIYHIKWVYVKSVNVRIGSGISLTFDILVLKHVDKH